MNRDWKERLKTEFGYSESLTNILINHGRVRDFRKDVRVKSQGEESKQLLFILEGSLVLIRDNPDATEQLAGILSSGYLLNEAYFYYALPADVHAYTLTEVTCLCLPSKNVHHLIEHNLEFNQAMAFSLSRKLLFFSQLSYVGKERDMTAKVRKAIYYLFQSSKLTVLPITIIQLASLLGMSRNTVSRALKESESSGAIELLSGTILLKNIEILGCFESDLSNDLY
ncbi:MAG: Crp/Fnr family transcriptional regulator [Endozoicomonas sp.]